MKNPLFLTIITMIILYFVWWLSGGTITGLRQRPAPVDYLTAFVWENFKIGAATIFDAISSVLNK